MDVKRTTPTKKEMILAILKPGTWTHMRVMQRYGGWRYGARVHELNAAFARIGSPKRIVSRRKPDGSYEYKLEVKP